MGVPVKPIRAAFGSATVMFSAKLGVLRAVRLVGHHDDVLALRQHRHLRRPSRGANFWIVVKTIPPAGTFSSSCRLSGAAGDLLGLLARPARGAAAGERLGSWLSRSVRSVTATIVGFANRGSRRSLLTKKTIV